MLTTDATLQPSLARDDAAKLLGQTMGLVAITAGVFALGAYLGRDLSPGWTWLWFIAALACLISMNFAARASEQFAVFLLFGFGALIGLAVAPAISYYANTNPRALWEAGGATGLFIAGFGAAGDATRRDLSAYIRYFFWALLALIGFGIVLIFIEIPHGSLIYAALGLAIFAGFTLFDFQRLRRAKDIRTAPLLAASIFLDILNVFLLFLTIFGNSRE